MEVVVSRYGLSGTLHDSLPQEINIVLKKNTFLFLILSCIIVKNFNGIKNLFLNKKYSIVCLSDISQPTHGETFL